MRSFTTRAVAVCALAAVPLLGVGRGVRAQTPAATARWIPARPVVGTLAYLVVTPRLSGPLAVDGRLAGEPLHFDRVGARAFRALAPLPIDATDSLEAVIIVGTTSGAADTIRVAVPLAHGAYRLERLRVAPQFGTEPDSALGARIAAEGELARGVARRSHETPRLWRAPFVRPRPGRVTSGFGNGREFNGEVQSRHMGTDFAGAVGAPVRASNRGVIALVADFFLGGRVIYIDHGAGVTTGYLHLSRTLVAEGDTVARGQIIGRVGRSGRVTGPHLHWVARYGGISVDPLSVVRVTASAPAATRAKARKKSD